MAACRSESGSGIVQLALAKLSPTAYTAPHGLNEEGTTIQLERQGITGV